LPVGADAGVGDHRIAADRVGAAGKRETSGTREQRGDGQAAAEDAGAACLYERARARAIADDGAAAAARSDDQLARGKKIDSGPAAFAADLEPAGKVGGRLPPLCRNVPEPASPMTASPRLTLNVPPLRLTAPVPEL
jgi:hypothetical protein